MKGTTIAKIIKAVNAECEKKSRKWVLVLLDNGASIYCNKLIMVDSGVAYYQDNIAIGMVLSKHILSITLHSL